MILAGSAVLLGGEQLVELGLVLKRQEHLELHDEFGAGRRRGGLGRADGRNGQTGGG